MIVVDANLFLRAMTAQSPTDDPDLFRAATALFSAARAGEAQFTTSEVIIAEVVWVLSGRYQVDRSVIAAQLRGLFTLSGCRMPTRDLCVVALTTWAAQPKLSFIDALVSTMAEQSGAQLATLDRALARHTSAALWRPPSPAE